METTEDTDNRTYLYGHEGEDTLTGSDDASKVDYLYGGDDADTIDGKSGVDYLYGQSGDDTLKYDAADRVINGGENFDTLLVDLGNFDLNNVNKISNIEKIELGDTSSITDGIQGINIADVIKITGGNTLIINDINDSNQTVNIDTNIFTKISTAAGVDTYSAIESGTTYTIEIDSTITVD